jgi:hypothetical protein
VAQLEGQGGGGVGLLGGCCWHQAQLVGCTIRGCPVRAVLSFSSICGSWARVLVLST